MTLRPSVIKKTGRCEQRKETTKERKRERKARQAERRK
jgi:hypothetical protein